MNFAPELIDKIASGRKTQTRRPGKCRWTVGNTYPATRRKGGPEVLTIRVTAIRSERLGAITPQDAQAEGFKNVDKFFAFWERVYGSVDREALVSVLEFERVPEEPEIYMGRKTGYTEIKGFSPEPEAPAVPPRLVDQINARRAKGLDLGAQEALRKQRARVRANQLRDSDHQARVKGIDIGSEMEAIDRYLDVIRDKLNEAA